jgi:hypothetical protein
MLISQPAFAYLEAVWRHLRGEDPESAETADASGTTGWAESPRSAPTAWWAESWEGTAEPRLDNPASVAAASPEGNRGDAVPDRPSPIERRARAAAFRALLLARQRRHGEAAGAFAEALTLEPTLDLTETPTFWDLERTAHLAAADAYEAVGRTRDAMTLRGRVELRFRPRLLRTG